MENLKLTDRERRFIVHEKSIKYAPNPKGLGYEFYHAMRQNLSSIAQIDARTGATDSYGCLLQRCIRISLRLLMRGITRNDIICSCTGNQVNSCVPVIAALFVGVKVAPLDPSLTQNEMSYILNQLKPKIIFASLDAVNLIENVCEQSDLECEIITFGHTLNYTKFGKLLYQIKDSDFSECTFEPLSIENIKDTALILYSSKLPGFPRGACISHHSLMMQMVNAVSCWNVGDKLYMTNHKKDKERGLSIALNTMTLSSITGIVILSCSLVTGITRIICSQFDAVEMWHLINKHNISFVACSSHQAIELYKAGKPEGVEAKSLRLLLTTNQPLSKMNLFELRKMLPRCFITNFYEQVEACGAITAFNSIKSMDIRDQYENPTSCGKLVPGIACKIVDPHTDKILGPNQIGELRYKSDFVMNGYFGMDSSSVFDRDGWIKTGDVGYYDKRGLFYVLERITEIFNYKHRQILPSTIEATIKEHPAVKDAAVIGVPDRNSDKVPLGFVALNKGMKSKATESDIEGYVNKNVSDKLKLRGGVKIVKEIPLTTSGKPKKSELESEFKKGTPRR